MALQDWLRPETGQDFQDNKVAILLLVVIFHGVLFIWQAIGVIRASEAHIRGNGFMAPVWGAQLALAVTCFFVITYAVDAWQMTLPHPDNARIDFETERAAKYSIKPTPDGKSLTLTGSLEIGITGRFKDQLEAYPHVEQVVLASTGGNIFQARGLSNTIRQKGLNTLVLSECSSACTIVFIGGIERHVAVGAKLGFHQYRIDADYTVLNADTLRQQDTDRAIFHQSGVESWFLDVMFNSRASEMWFPELTELLEANVVTGTE